MHTSQQQHSLSNSKLLYLSQKIDNCLLIIGKYSAWCLFALTAVTLYDVVSRRIPALAFFGSTGLQELEWHLHTILFAFLFAGVLVKDMNVRVDIFRERFPKRFNLHIELWGTILLALPYVLTVIYFGVLFVSIAFIAGEGSTSSHGLPYRWVIKSAIPLGMGLLLLAIISHVLKQYIAIKNNPVNNHINEYINKDEINSHKTNKHNEINENNAINSIKSTISSSSSLNSHLNSILISKNKNKKIIAISCIFIGILICVWMLFVRSTSVDDPIDWVYYLPIFMFLSLTILMFSGYPVAFILGGIGLLFGGIATWMDAFSLIEFFNILPRTWTGVAENLVLVAGPMFIWMGMILERSGIAEDLIESIRIITRKVPAGLAIGIVLIGAIMGATTGVVSATVVMMTVLALPTLKRAGYKNSLAAGTIAGAGTLGIIIPPSVMLVFMGDILQVSIGKLFMAALVPGLLTAIFYIIMLFAVGVVLPKMAPKATDIPDRSFIETFMIVLKGIVAPIFLIMMVLGSIFKGWATPTEAAAVGAFGALLLTILKGRFTLKMLTESIQNAAFVSAMIFFIVFGATVFSYVFRSIGGETILLDAIEATALGPYGTLLLLVAVIFLAGFFFDWIEIALIFLPIFGPVIVLLFAGDFSGRRDELVWFGIIVGMVLQTSFLSPPFGYTLFYMKGAMKGEYQVKMSEIYQGVIPFIIIQMLIVGLIIAFPEIALWLPNKIFG